MHASTEQLLKVADGELRSDEVCTCDACVEALRCLSARRRALRELPPVEPPADGWQRLQEAIDESAAPPQISKTWHRLAASLGAVAAVLMTVSWLQGSPGSALLTGGEAPADVSQLMDQSRELEALLAAIEQRSPRVMDATRADFIASIEDRIAMVDYGLSHPEEINLSQAESRRLWEERVSLMATLVEVQTVRVQEVDF